MANKLTVQEQEAITNLVRLGWGIRKIARELGLSRNTVRGYARSVEVLSAEAIAEEILRGSPPSSTIETDPLSTPGSATTQNQTDPFSTAGNTGRKSLCADHAEFILAKCEAGLSAQRILPGSSRRDRLHRFLSVGQALRAPTAPHRPQAGDSD
jgi:hypothetical protein